MSDPGFEPYVRSEEIADWFGVSTATMHSKAKIIREGLDLMRLDPEFTLPSRLEDNPLVWILQVNGFPMDIRHAPREAQEAAYDGGLIPYIPADREETESPYAVFHGRIPSSGAIRNSMPQPADVAYQIKITLEGSKPPIWRRVQVSDCTLAELHDVIQISMGWEDCHLHEFQVGETRYGRAETDEMGETIEESNVLLSSIAEQGCKKFRYWYDFGDDWWHTIELEATEKRSPKSSPAACLEGARACPPEDVGGIWGYAEFLETLANPKHPNHKELTEWAGGHFDPDLCDLAAINKQLSRL